jgi:hypothetical protein
MRWLEIPAHRLLEVERNELIEEFDMYDEAGKLCGSGKIYLLFRKKDGKRFRFAQFGDLHGSVKKNCVYLQEV